MNGVELLLIAVGLAMDAFAVSVGKGLTIQGQCKKACIVTGLYFGGFQSIMPLLGFLCGETVIQYIAPISRILSFILLTLIGLNMLRETIKETSTSNSASIAAKVMIPAAIATSIDAFAVMAARSLRFPSCCRVRSLIVRMLPVNTAVTRGGM